MPFLAMEKLRKATFGRNAQLSSVLDFVWGFILLEGVSAMTDGGRFIERSSMGFLSARSRSKSRIGFEI